MHNKELTQDTPVLEKSQEIEAPKRGRGRPRKYPVNQEVGEKRGRGRPRKYPIMEKERLPNGDIRPLLKKVDSAYLMKHMVTYFTKLLILHHELAKSSPQHEVIFKRLKTLDFQMAEVCKTVLSREFPKTLLEENKEVA